MTIKRTRIGRETEAALGEVLLHVRGKIHLMCRIVDDPKVVAPGPGCPNPVDRHRPLPGCGRAGT